MRVFDKQTKKKILDEENFRSIITKFMKRKEIKYDEIRKISHQTKKSGGFCAVAASSSGDKRCLVAKSGYKMRFPRYTGDEGQFDTLLYVRYCDSNVRCEDFSDLFSGIDLVKDRAAFRAAIQASTAARTVNPADNRFQPNSGCHDVAKNIAYLIAEGEACLDGDVSITIEAAKRIQSGGF